ncbi:MAG: hypothetical protein K8S55_13455 [Phycisphaerae bacterium]|nr:hypothetical protein [Phycisphaerae bacterium]
MGTRKISVRKITVRKRDGRTEGFDVEKLAGSLWRGLQPAGGAYRDARELALAIRIYLHRKRRRSIPSAAIFEMGLKVLRRVRRGPAAELLELHRTLRTVRRRLLRISHDDGNVTQWDKSWAANLAVGIWQISPATARIIAGEIELDILPCEETEISRRSLLERLNRRVAEYGLADAVPVR